MSATAAKVLVDTLALHGLDRFYCVPGESYLAIMDALYDDPKLKIITCRHEAGAGLMAVADAKATGRAAALVVSRGPGLSNAMVALHTAEQDAVPLILFVGNVPRIKAGRRAHQEADLRKTFSHIAKRVEEAIVAESLPDMAARAIRIAESGTPGPVVIGLPTDLLPELTDAAPVRPRGRPRALPSDVDVSAVADAISGAERPLLIAGELARSPESREALLACSETWGLPVLVTFENRDIFSNGHPHYAGELGIRPPPAVPETARDADLVLAVGTRLPDLPTQGYTLLGAGQRLIHVYDDANQIGISFETELGIVAEAAPFLAALAARNPPVPPAGRDAWIARAHDGYAEAARLEPRSADDGIDFGHIIQALIGALADDAVITADSGTFASWLHRHFPFKSSQLLLGSEAGAMGLAVPGAVAAALRYPDRQVVALVGDGGFLMTGNELATAMQEGAKMVVIVANNASYGTIRFHQETRYPGRPLATGLTNPDFAALARSFGALGLTIAEPAEAEPVLRQALAADCPVVVDVKTSLECLTAVTTIDELRSG